MVEIAIAVLGGFVAGVAGFMVAFVFFPPVFVMSRFLAQLRPYRVEHVDGDVVLRVPNDVFHAHMEPMLEQAVVTHPALRWYFKGVDLPPRH
jgi:hypothetical protein